MAIITICSAGHFHDDYIEMKKTFAVVGLRFMAIQTFQFRMLCRIEMLDK
jgi:hypothetical protein